MAGKTSKKWAKVAKKTAATRAAAKSARRPSRVEEKPAATRPKGAAGKGERSAATKAEERSASTLIDRRIQELSDWRGKTLQQVREIIKEADPEIVEEWKWVKPTNPGTPVWSHDGIVCTGESYKNLVKLTFAKGASLKDPTPLFNSSLDGNVRRAIDIREGERVDASAFKALVREAVALNRSGKSKPSKKMRS